MMIEELRLTSFKGFRDFDLKCSAFTTLVGVNSSGKTSILQAVQFLYDLVIFAFGNREEPNFANPQWSSNPNSQIQRLSFGDPDALWLHKRTTEPCKIAAKLSDGNELTLEVTGRNNYDLDLLRNGTSIRGEVSHNLEYQSTVQEFFALRPTYVPPVGMISPTETFIPYTQLTQQRDRGQIAEGWRNRLFWLWNDGGHQQFDEITELVRRYLPSANVLRPRFTRDSSPMVRIEFEEGGTTFDISSSGGGLRTLLNLAVVLRSSGSRCLLLDEPDAHLHGSLQRAIATMLIDHATENNVQVFVASHAPEFIAEVPVEHLLWIDRDKAEAIPCNEISRFLVDLGVVTNAEAIQAHGADKILFVEGSTDRTILAQLIMRSGRKKPFDDQTVIIASLPSGKGDSKYLRIFQELSREVYKLHMKIVCIIDSDYGLKGDSATEPLDEFAPLILPLGRKEVENYLLDPDLINAAAVTSAEKRKKRTGPENILVPSVEEISSELTRILDDPRVRDKVKYQVRPRYQDTLPKDLDPSTKDEKADEWFREKWGNMVWQIANCPGKEVLRALRLWCQDNYSLNLSTRNLIEQFKECPKDIDEIAEKMEVYFCE